MKISKSGLDLIKSFEGFQSKIYICPAGLKTIGFGHVIKSNELFDEITLSQAEELLKTDIEQFEKALNKLISGIKLSQNQFDALISFIYNVGVGSFIQSTMYKLLQNW